MGEEGQPHMLAHKQPDGLAGFGAVLVETTTSWTDGGATDNLGVGLAAWAGTTTLTRVDLSHAHWSGGPLLPSLDPGGAGPPPAFGGVFLGGAAFRTTVRIGSHFGGAWVFHNGCSARHYVLAA